jgi:hypothetical protein
MKPGETYKFVIIITGCKYENYNESHSEIKKKYKYEQ